jgi:hypothetical protein
MGPIRILALLLRGVLRTGDAGHRPAYSRHPSRSVVVRRHAASVRCGSRTNAFARGE